MKRLLPLLLILTVAACTSLGWRGGGPRLAPEPETPSIATHSHARAPDPVVPPATEIQRQTALYDSDLGPEEVDISGYPLQQRANYRVYASACSRCHGLARSINSPLASRTWWEFYVLSMRARGSLAGKPLSKDEVKAVLDFLEYDGHERKVLRGKEFEKVRAELKVRYESLMDERMDRLQRGGQPRVLDAR